MKLIKPIELRQGDVVRVSSTRELIRVIEFWRDGSRVVIKAKRGMFGCPIDGCVELVMRLVK